MENNDKYYVFIVEGEGDYYLGPFHFNDKFAYCDLHLWRFYADDYQIHFLQSDKHILVTYGKSEELTQILKDKGVAFSEHKIISHQENRILAEGGLEVKLEKNWQYSYVLKENSREVFNCYYNGNDLTTEFPNLHPNDVHRQNVLIKFEGKPDLEGNPPKEVLPYLPKKKENETTGSGILGLLIFGLFLTFVFYYGCSQ
jgi:hypothetical protein